MEYYVGIDFGTTNSIISYIEQGSDRVETFEVSTGSHNVKYVPSIVAYHDGMKSIGHGAFLQYQDAMVQDEDYYERFKMYLPISDKTEAATREKLFGHQWNKTKLPFDVTADYLQTLIEDFKKGQGGIKQIVLSVPENWQSDPGNPGAARLVQIAREQLRLPLLQLIPEPIAATVYYCNRTRRYGRVLVCDMGGGTFDVSLCNVSEKKAEVIENLGKGSYGKGKAGILFDMGMAEMLSKQIYGGEPVDGREMIRIRSEFENRKIASHDTSRIALEGKLKSVKSGGAPIEEARKAPIYRMRYERKDCVITFGDLLDAFVPIDEGIQETLKEVPKDSYDHLVIVGGFGRFPLVVDSIQRALNIEDAHLEDVFDSVFHGNIDSYLAISQGTALIAAEKVDVIEKFPHTIGLRTAKEVNKARGGQQWKEIIDYDNIIIRHKTNRDDTIHWSNLEYRLTSDNRQVEVTLFVDKKGNEADRTRHSVSIDVPASSSRDDIIRIGVKIDRNNRAEVYICDKRSLDTGHIEEATRLELGALIPDILVVG